MIQRKQTLFLLFSSIISILLFYLPVYEMLPVTESETVPSVTRFTISASAILLILNGAIGTLSFVAIFMYKRRNLQIRMCNLALLLTCVMIGLLFFVADTMSSGMNQRIHYLYGSYLPLIQVLMIFLAARFIKGDEDLIRSADRLR
jgi:hypothetical protein